MDRLPPFSYSMDSPFLSLSRQEVNRIIRLDLESIHIQRTWSRDQELPPKLQLYRDLFLRWSQEGYPQRPHYLETHMSHALRIVIGQLRVSSHRLQVETGRAARVPREQRICRLCTMGEVETEEHYVCRCPRYYEIRGRYHCLFQEGFGPLTRVMEYSDQRCLGLFLLEIRRLRDHVIRQLEPQGDGTAQRQITDYMTPLIDHSADHSDRARQPDDTRDRHRRRSRQTDDDLQARHVRPRTMEVQPLDALFRGISHVRGVTIDTARRIRSTRRPHTLVHHPTQRQIQIREMLSRHRQAPPPSAEDVIASLPFLRDMEE